MSCIRKLLLSFLLSIQWTFAFLALTQISNVIIGVSCWRFDCHVKVHDWLFKQKVKALFICDNYILVKFFLDHSNTKDCSFIYMWPPASLVWVEVLREGKVLQHSMCLWKEFHHIMAVVILQYCGSGSMISLIWPKDGWLLKGVVLISHGSLLPVFHCIWACLLGGRFLCGVFFCAEAVLDLRLGGSWKEGKGELGPPLLFAAFVVCKTSSWIYLTSLYRYFFNCFSW